MPHESAESAIIKTVHYFESDIARRSSDPINKLYFEKAKANIMLDVCVVQRGLQTPPPYPPRYDRTI